METLAESGESETLLSRPHRQSRPTSTPEKSGASTSTPSPPTLSPVQDASGQTTHFHSSGDATMEAPEISPAPTEVFHATYTIGPAGGSQASTRDPFEIVDLTP